MTVSDGAAEASAAVISEEKNDEAQSGVISALETETVEGIAPHENVALLGAFSMSVAHGGGSASFTIKLAEEMYFEGTPYVIIQNKNGELYRAFRAEYSGKALTFTVDALDDYFSEAIITIADVKDSANHDSRRKGQRKARAARRLRRRMLRGMGRSSAVRRRPARAEEENEIKISKKRQKTASRVKIAWRPFFILVKLFK